MKYWISFLLILLSFWTTAQKQPDPEFLNHLMNREYHQEVVHLIDRVDMHELSASFEDSLFYMRGWSLYSMKNLIRSAEDLNQVGIQSPFYHKSRFFAAYNYVHLEDYSRAMTILDKLKTNDPRLTTLKHFEKSGIALLRRDFEKFDREFAQVDTSYYPVAKESVKINQYATDLKNHRKKSPLLAGLMSGVIPGSGKIYAGKPGEGISSLLTVGGLGFVTWENYRKNGIKDFKTLLFGAAFTTFYIGNIYGTVFSVKIAENEFQKAHDHNILFNLHIPLRNTFN